jgi:hypothetical protein
LDLQPGFLASMFGGAIGSLLAGVGFLYKRSAEYQDEFRGLIFTLLGIYTSLRTTQNLTPRKYLEACAGVMERLGHENVARNEELYQIMEPLIKPQLEAMLSQVNDWDDEAYVQKLERIARKNPVLAHRLKSNTLLMDIIPQLRDYWVRYLEMLNDNQFPAEHVDAALPKMEDELVEYLLAELQSDILKISKTVGIIQYIKLKYFFYIYKKLTSEDILEPLFKKLLGEL